MSITILRGDYGRIDFATPIEMNDEQIKQFESFLKQMFDPVMFQPASEFRSARLGSQELPSRWTAEEYAVLLRVDDYASTARKLGRSEMSVMMKAGQIIPRLLQWCDENKLSLDDISVQVIERYLKEVEEAKLAKRADKKLRTETVRVIEQITTTKNDPCMVGDPTFFGGECKNGFHKGCFTCHRHKKHIKTEDDIKLFNEIRNELLKE